MDHKVEGSYDGEFRRPDHPDFMDSSELQALRFTGVRNNSISEDVEIWVLGERRRCISKMERELNSRALEQAMAEVFKQDAEKMA